MVDLFAQYMARVLSGEKSDELVSGESERGEGKKSPYRQRHRRKFMVFLRAVNLVRLGWEWLHWLKQERLVEDMGEERERERGRGRRGWMRRVPFRFLYISRLNELRDTYDPSQTFEGENNILVQQASNYLLSQKKQVRMGKRGEDEWMNSGYPLISNGKH